MTLPSPGQNLILNGTFSNGTKNWVTDYSTITNALDKPSHADFVRVQPQPGESIAGHCSRCWLPNTDYTLGPRPVGFGRWDGCVLFKDGSVNASRVVTSTAWQPVSPFRTGAGYTTRTPDAENWKGDEARTSKSMISKSAPKAASGSTRPIRFRLPRLLRRLPVHRLSTRTSGSYCQQGVGRSERWCRPENVSTQPARVPQSQANGDGTPESVTGRRSKDPLFKPVTRDYYAPGKYEGAGEGSSSPGARTAF